MACIILKSDFGERKIPENQNYRLLKGEAIVGVDWDCEGEEQRDVKAELERQGVQWGDAIAWVASKAGFKECSACTRNKHLYNESLVLGIEETARRIKNFAKNTINGKVDR